MNYLEKKHENFYENLPVMMHSINPEGFIVKVNKKWLETLGYTREEVLGRKSISFLTEESRERAIREVLPDFMVTGYCENINYEFVAKNGKILNILLSATSEKDENGNLLNSLAILNNITSLKMVKNELKLVINEKEIIKQEVSHRTKNHLQTLISLISLKMSGLEDI